MTLSQRQWYRWLMPILLHRSFLHVLITILTQFIIISIVERILIMNNVFKIYFISGIGSTLFGCLINDDLSVGPSGAIFGVCGAFVIYRKK